MYHNRSFFISFILISLILSTFSVSAEINILPKTKPKIIDSDETFSGIIKPKKKPNINNEIIIETKKIKPTKNEFLLPIKKPLIVKKELKNYRGSSQYYTDRDFSIAKKSINLMEKGMWNDAVKHSRKSKKKSISNFIKWRFLLTSNNKASFYDYAEFINANPNYARIERLKYLAEHKLTTNIVKPDKIIKWFGGKEPLSGYGRLILGESLISIGNESEGINLIKKGWIDARLSKSDLKRFRKKFKNYLNTQDYINRADHLAWEGKYWDLRRMLVYLPKDQKLLYDARQLLMSKSYGVDAAISKVPEKLKNDAGLNYERLKWRRKRGRTESSLEILLKIKNSKKYLVRPDKWWKERSIIARSLIYKKKYEIAYKITSNHGLENGPEYADAEWMSGWIALSFLSDPFLALDHFNNFYSKVSYPISLSRGAYWLGKTYEQIGDAENSIKWYQIASKYLTTYYGQLAYLKIYPNENFTLTDDMIVDNKIKEEFYKNELVKIVLLLDDLDKDKYTKKILRHLAKSNIENGSEILAAELATKISRYDYAIQISKIASYEKRFHNKYNYPIISTPKKVHQRKIPESAFILSIIRQESEFDMSANSSAGAKGLMQLMPYTAKLVSKQANLPYTRSRLTTDPEYNINLGSHYIAGLILEYEGAYPFAIAAYNAGPKRVKYWKKINKNPQKNQIDYVDWIELIKFKETRNYVQRVLENYNVYRYILEKKPIKMKNFFKNETLY
ncbi:MAG: lytic transglycosylase domain-containing protein [Candidatus Pelagibacter sp.]